jgi:hypothetical protein
MEEIDNHDSASSGISTDTPCPLQVRYAINSPPSLGSTAFSTESTLISDLLILITVTSTNSTVPW